MYVANHYVRVNGKMFVAGEVLPEISEEKAAWLIWAGAIHEIAPVPDLTEGSMSDRSGDTTNGQTEEEGKNPPPESETTEGETPESEIEEEAEPEEIDVMAGIVTDTKAPPKTKSGSSKTGGKRGRK